jgi:hypothetical protein
VKRRLLAGAAFVMLLAAPAAFAQDGYSGGWIDPSPSGMRDGRPIGYLDSARALTGEVSHPNGISSVSVVLVPDPDHPVADGCDASMDGPAATEPNGTSMVFRAEATFPCNLVYEIRATAQANAGGGGLGDDTPTPYAMPLFVAVAIPPAPVSYLDAVLEIEGDDRRVELTWPEGPEPDLLGYVVARDGETLGQVGAGERTRFVDDEPTTGTTSYSVTAVREGPDDTVEQVPAEPTTVAVEVPADEDDADAVDTDGDGEPDSGGAGGEPADPEIASEQEAAEARGAPLAGGLSSVAARGQAPPTIGPPTTVDTGYAETLPFDPRDPEQLAAAPNGDPAVVTVFEEVDPLDEKQRYAFIAGGLAVLVGAAVIMHVTRRAAREAY